MGGKTKQSQRTKNNARPSSSGRSAELLSSVKLDSGVVSIAGTQLPALFPSLVAPSVDPLISPELQLCLKKLNKKDPITKTKALQELTELVANSTVDDVVSALSSWSHFYKILTADPDRKVRECTQACHGAIVSVCGRRLAPQLKQLMPTWLQAQYDEHAPAHTHAQNSLAKTFPDTKLPEVLSYCKEPIISHLLDVLIGNGEAAHIRTTDSSEERELQVCRVLTCCLHGLQYYVTYLPATHSDWLEAELVRLLQANAFWNQATNTDVRIRAAWYGALGSIISRFKQTFAAQYGVKTLRVLVGGRDSNPLAAAHLWECLLLFMHNVPDWHQYLEKKELLSKRILDVLESGGWGDARHLSNMLLLILASLPEQILTKDFYIAFFSAIFSGLEKKTILSSKSERQYWITSLQECLRYLSTQAQPYVIEVVTSVHRTWLEKVLSDTEGQTRNHLIKYSAGSMANLLKYWLKQANDSTDDKYDQLIRNFWQNVGSTLTSQVDKVHLNHEDIDKLMEAHILLLQTLKTSFKQELKKQLSIKFEVDSRAAENKPSTEPQVTDPSITDRYNHNLNELVQKICGHYLEFARTKQISNPVISPLITLLVEFDSKSLFLGIAGQFGCDSVYKLYESVLRSWLAGDTMRCKAVVDIVFMVMQHLTENEQDALFDTFKQFPPSVVEWCISLSVSHPHCTSPAVRRWLRGALVQDTVTAICTRLIHTGAGPARSLLLMCLNCDAHGESVVSPAAVDKALQQLSLSLYEVESAALEARSGLAAQLAATLPPNATLLTALLSLTTTLQRGDPRLSLETWCEVRDAWQDGVTSLHAHTRTAFLHDAAAILHTHLNLHSNLVLKTSQPETSTKSKDTGTELNISKLEHIVSLCPYLLWCSSELNIPEVVSFTQTIFDIAPSDPMLIHAYAIRHLILTGNLNCPFEENPVVKAIANETLTELSKDNLIAYLNTVLFRMMYLRTMFLNRPDDESDRNWCKELLAETYFQRQLVNCIHDYVLICTLYDGYAFWPHYKLIEQSKNRLQTLLDDIINETTPDIRRSITTSLSELATSEGYFWAYSRKYFEDQTIDDHTCKVQQSEKHSPSDKEDSQNDVDSSQSDKDVIESDKNISQSDKDISQSDKNSNSEVESKVESKEIKESSEETNPLMKNLKDIITGPTLLHTLHYLQAKARKCSDESEVLRTEYYLVLANMYIAHAHEPEVLETFLRDVTAHSTCTPDVIVNTYYAHNHTMLYEKDISLGAWAQVLSNASSCRFLRGAVGAAGWQAAPHHWDFTNITLCSLLTSIQLSINNWGTTKVAVLARSALRLFSTVCPFIKSVPMLCLSRQPSDHVASLPTEWNDIYAPDLHHNLFSIILFVLESSKTTCINSNHMAVLDSLIQAAPHMQWESLALAHRTGAYNLQRLVAVCTTTLREPVHSAFKYLAYGVMRMLLKPLVLEDAEKLAAWSHQHDATDSEEGSPLELTLSYYGDALVDLQDIVETALSHVRVCEEVCTMVPFSDAHALALGWLLLGDLLNQQCMLARQDLTHQYIQIYREQPYAEPLLSTSLRLLPQAVLTQAAATTDSPFHNNVTNTYKDMFTALPALDVYSWCGSEAVGAAACRCVCACVRGAGAARARGWRGAAHHRHANILDNITRRYITPHVVKEEFALLQKKSSDIEDCEVTINRSSLEISCVLSVDERGIELVVRLSRQHPLVLPRITAEHSAAGNISWILMYLGYQNGTILNALKMWTVSVNNKMEKAPQCYICYCRLHHATGRLPNVYCHTCKNKFHNVCLRKWFLSSSKMTCPLCRANF